MTQHQLIATALVAIALAFTAAKRREGRPPAQTGAHELQELHSRQIGLGAQFVQGKEARAPQMADTRIGPGRFQLPQMGLGRSPPL